MLVTLTMSALLAACSSTSVDERAADERAADEQAADVTTTLRGGPEATDRRSLPEPTSEVLAQVAALTGRLAVLSDGALRLIAPDGGGEEFLEAGVGVSVSQPTWSRDGSRLAWTTSHFPSWDGGAGLATEVVVRDIATGQNLTSDLSIDEARYLQWSSDGTTIAYVRPDPAQPGLDELGLVTPGAPPVRLGSVPFPLYLSWAPERPLLAAHISLQQVVVVPRPEAAATEPEGLVLNPSGRFLAPAWIDDDTLLVASTEGLIRMAMITGDLTVVVDTGGGPIQFVLSPDRSRVAFQLPGRPGAVSLASLRPADLAVSPTTTSGADSPAGGSGDDLSGTVGPGLKVADLRTGEIVEVTAASPLAFEWSPDSERLAWLEWGVGGDDTRVRWNFWDGVASTPSASYEPSTTVRDDYVPLFEQYAQSVTGWSPDSSAFAFAGRPNGAEGEVDGIWVQLVGVPGAAPVRVGDGDVVAWSPT